MTPPQFLIKSGAWGGGSGIVDRILGFTRPSEGFPRLAYLGPGAGWDGGREDFENSRRSARPIRALGPWALGLGPLGPWAQDLKN